MQALTCCHNNKNKKGGADCSVLISLSRICGILCLNPSTKAGRKTQSGLTVLSLQAHVQQENPAISLAIRFGTGKHVWKLLTNVIIGGVLVVGALENIAQELEIFVSQRSGLTMVG